jgi:hypothetical protein
MADHRLPQAAKLTHYWETGVVGGAGWGSEAAEGAGRGSGPAPPLTVKTLTLKPQVGTVKVLTIGCGESEA